MVGIIYLFIYLFRRCNQVELPVLVYILNGSNIGILVTRISEGLRSVRLEFCWKIRGARMNCTYELCNFRGKSCYCLWSVPSKYLILVMSLWENGDLNNGVSS